MFEMFNSHFGRSVFIVLCSSIWSK